MPLQHALNSLAPGNNVCVMRDFNSLPVTLQQQKTHTILSARDAIEQPNEKEELEQLADADRRISKTVFIREVSYSSNPSYGLGHKVPKAVCNDIRFHSIKCQNEIQDESLARHHQQLMKLTYQYEYQEISIRDIKENVKTLEDTIQRCEARGGNGIYVWRIRNFFKFRREAENGDTTAIHSASFYSSFYGYKLCIRVNLNGVDSARGSHLSLFIHFMEGEYDDLLEWPFNGRIILTVIDQNQVCEMRNDISETLMSKPNLVSFQRPVSYRNPKGIGYREFLPLTAIDNSTYVRNDTLLIKANVIPASS